MIDASASFAHGQTYVALSRCRTLEGIVLKSKISEASVINDQRVQQFNQKVADHEPDEQVLITSQITFQLQLITELFDFYPLLRPLDTVLKLAYKNQTVIQGNILTQLNTLKQAVSELVKISHGFKTQLESMSKNGVLPEQDTAIQARFAKALPFYQTFLVQRLQEPLDQLTFDSGNKEIRKDIDKHLDNISDFLWEKDYNFNGLGNAFNAKVYMRSRAKAKLDKPQKKKKTDRKDYSEHPELFKELCALRAEYADVEMVGHYQIFTQQSLYDICEKLPVTLNQLKKIKGMGKVRIQRYGQDIIDIVHEYCEQNHITPDLSEPEVIPKKTITKGQTQLITLQLYQEGLSVQDIAKQRSLAKSTIESHLAQLISKGQLKVEEVLPSERFQALKTFMTTTDYDNLNDLRQKVGEDYSFGELRMMHNAIVFEKNN